nr:serine hydrolase [Brevibacterium sp. 91QC2O2]
MWVSGRAGAGSNTRTPPRPRLGDVSLPPYTQRSHVRSDPAAEAPAATRGTRTSGSAASDAGGLAARDTFARRRGLAWLAACLATAIVLVTGAVHAPDPAEAAKPRGVPSVDASSYIIGSLDTGNVLAACNRNDQMRPASTLKLLTALGLADYYKDKKTRIKISKATAGVEPTKIGVKAGYSYTADQLFHAMLIMSANDASQALAQGAGGTKKAMAIVNAKAKQIGMKNTVAKTPNGLDAPGQHVTAKDMMVLAKHFTQNKYLMSVVKKTSYTFPGGVKYKTKGGKQVVSKRSGSQKIYSHTKIAGFIKGGQGLKNGWTSKALGTFVAVAKRGGKSYVVVILHSSDQPRRPAIDMLDWAFTHRSASVGKVDFKKLEQKPKPKPKPKPTPTPSKAPALSPGTTDDNAGPNHLTGGVSQ